MKLVFATHNQNKFKEVKALLPSSIELLSLTDIDCNEDIPETEETIEGNAKLKVAHVRKHYNLNCFGDDTGLEVASLNNEPGVYSARYSGKNATADTNMDKLLTNLEGKEDRSARFKTAIALDIDGKEELFIGLCEGRITEERSGSEGFGYDPIFLPNEADVTFAEMTMEEKSKIGHRGRAMRQLIEFLNA
ncbi:putative xanthosine triphosphate pyrophosphatase [unidentified eubacterium SCB49]|nr:putative xanthosine triphosphate pyrophosphatase [unidentified eubacterium SCB49]